MVFEQTLLEAKVEKRQQLIKLALIFSAISFLLLSTLLVVTYYQDSSGDSVPDSINQNNAIIEQTDLSANSDDLRQDYIGALSDYENRIKPQLAKIDLVRWDKTRADQLIMLEDKALSSFSIADYAAAVTTIKTVIKQAQAIIDDSQELFQQALSQAQTAYDNDQYDEAQLQISQAMILDNSSIQAIQLSAKIATLPTILSLIDKANTAKVENNYRQELDYLNAIIKQDPLRTSASKRRQDVITIIATNHFNNAVRQAYQAIEQGNVVRAKQQLKSARKIYPNRTEIAEIMLALQQLEQQQRIASYHSKVQTAMAADNWPVAKQQLNLILQEQPNEKATQALLDKVNRIIDLNKQFEYQLKHPYRLANKSAQEKAQKNIDAANVFVKDSKSLQQASNKLSELLLKMTKKITVEITSDNQTTILVRSVGVVGKTALKEIQLTPGNYTFEGKRKGYKSKLLNVLIPYDQTYYSLSIQCDERI